MSTDSIGSAGGRDFATIADWWAGIPSILLENEIGEMYNDSEFVVTTQIDLSGKTVGAFTITLRAATGQGFKDSQNSPGFKLTYSASQGVAVTSVTGYLAPLIIVNNGTALTVDGIQFRTQNGTSSTCSITDGTVKNCILDSNGAQNSLRPVTAIGGVVINCLCIQRKVDDPVGAAAEYGGTILNCTVIMPSNLTAAGTGVVSGSGNNVVKNTAVFNFTTCFDAGWDAASDRNMAADTSAPGGNSLQSQTYGNQFVSTTDNWKLTAGATAIGAAITDALATTDILGNSRGAAGGASDIGAHEFISSPAAPVGRQTASNRLPASNRQTATNRQPASNRSAVG